MLEGCVEYLAHSGHSVKGRCLQDHLWAFLWGTHLDLLLGDLLLLVGIWLWFRVVAVTECEGIMFWVLEKLHCKVPLAVPGVPARLPSQAAALPAW